VFEFHPVVAEKHIRQVGELQLVGEAVAVRAGDNMGLEIVFLKSGGYNYNTLVVEIVQGPNL